MAPTQRTRKLLWARSGGHCARCQVALVQDLTHTDGEAIIGEECHIVSPKKTGPRFAALPDYDTLDNLILLCSGCHSVIDLQPDAFPADVVRTMRERHEQWVADRFANIPSVRPRMPRPRYRRGRTLIEYLTELLAADYIRDGPRVGEFTRLSDRSDEMLYQQAGSVEALSIKPAYYHTYWGIRGVSLLFKRTRGTYFNTTAKAISERFGTGRWLRIALEDYEASPTQRTSHLDRVRHTARASSILWTCHRLEDLASEIAWALVSDLPEVMVSGGVPEVRLPGRPPSIHASAAVLQALSLAREHSHLPDQTEFLKRAEFVSKAIRGYLRFEWERNRWSFNNLPWQINAPSVLANLAPYISADLRCEVARTLRAEIFGRGVSRVFDAPEPIYSLRIAYAVSTDQDQSSDDEFADIVDRLAEKKWDEHPLQTADIVFLAELILRYVHR